MSQAGATARKTPTPERRKRRETLVYVVEVAPTEPDPKAAAKLRAWLLARVR